MKITYEKATAFAPLDFISAAERRVFLGAREPLSFGEGVA